jgi:hypothetical protein
MKSKLSLLLAMIGLLVAPLFAAAHELANFAAFLDAGAPLRGKEGRGVDFGRSFVGLALQARLGGKFHAECSLAFFPGPWPGDKNLYNSDGFELALDGLWKIAAGKRVMPFIRIGLSYAWITSNHASMEIRFPDAGRQTERWLGVNAGGGVEFALGRRLLLRVGGIFTFVPFLFETLDVRDVWGKIFAGLGLRF